MDKSKHIVTLPKGFQDFLRCCLEVEGLNNEQITDAMQGRLYDLEDTIGIGNVIEIYRLLRSENITTDEEHDASLVYEALETCIEGVRDDFKTSDYTNYFLKEIRLTGIDRNYAKALIIKGIKGCTGGKFDNIWYRKAVANIVKSL